MVRMPTSEMNRFAFSGEGIPAGITITTCTIAVKFLLIVMLNYSLQADLDKISRNV
jgi:hypothetical protein